MIRTVNPILPLVRAEIKREHDNLPEAEKKKVARRNPKRLKRLVKKKVRGQYVMVVERELPVRLTPRGVPGFRPYNA